MWKLLWRCSIEVFLGAHWHILPAHLNSLLQEGLLWVMCTPVCSWCLIAIGPFVSTVNPSGWVIIWLNLCHPKWEVVQGLLPVAGLFPAGSGACRDPPLAVLLIWLVGSSSGAVWSSPIILFVCFCSIGMGYRFRSLSDIVCNYPSATCL